MPSNSRPICIHHCTPEPFQFFGRTSELKLLDNAFHQDSPSLVALVGPGGQGKTAIVQTWINRFLSGSKSADGVFLWSFYRGKDSDLCIRELYRYAKGLDRITDIAAGYCVDQLLKTIRSEKWAVVLDGAEVVQHEAGSWYGRFLHPELGRLLEDIAAEPMKGVVILTTRFPLPTLEKRKYARILSLESLDSASAIALLHSLGVRGEEKHFHKAAEVCGYHAKAVELLGTYLAHYCQGDVNSYLQLPKIQVPEGASIEEANVSQVLAAFQEALTQEEKDFLALATAFRNPPTVHRLLQYLESRPVETMLHEAWQRSYSPFSSRGHKWLEQKLNYLIDLRLLEQVHSGQMDEADDPLVIDTHPLVRRGFEYVLGPAGQKQNAQARAGFLSGRPDRKPPGSLDEAREEVELFHAYCDAGMWNEADRVYVALNNPKHRFLAPAFERDLLLRFFPEGNWRDKPIWSGFGRQRSLAISFEMLGQYEDALGAYPPNDQPLCGDALIALGRLIPLLEIPQVSQPWQNLWQAYRCHGLCLAGKTDEALTLAKTLIPIDVYEWVHVFECLLRLQKLTVLDLRSVLYRPPHSGEHHWSQLARQRMKLDYFRLVKPKSLDETQFRQLIEEYDRGGLPFERALTRLSFARWLQSQNQKEEAKSVSQLSLELSRRFSMAILEADALGLLAELGEKQTVGVREHRQRIGFLGPFRP